MIQNPQIHVTQIENVDNDPLVRVGSMSYAGVIPLSDIKNDETRTIRFHITWDNNENNNEIDSLYGSSSATFDIPMSITFRQYTGETIVAATPTPVPTATPQPTSTPIETSSETSSEASGE
jgi:hypothetical protein